MRQVPEGRLGATLLVVLPPLLAAISWLVGWVSAPALGPSELVAWALLPTLAMLGVRLVLSRRARTLGAGRPQVVGLFLLHQALLCAAILLNPLTCIYAFLGYLDASRFLIGRAVRVSVVVTALLCALGQSGGIAGVVTVPALFVMLILVNVLLSLGMLGLDAEREREVARRERSARALEDANRENAELHEQLLQRARESGIAEERTRLAREIHDTVAQGLVGVVRQLEAVPDGVLDASSQQRLRTAQETARESLLDARRAVEALAPQQLEEGEAISALVELVARWSRAHRIVATLDADDAPHPLPHAHTVVRIVQEALANIARHAHAGSVSIILREDEEDGGLDLRIADDGRGFDQDAGLPGHGLEGMRSRIEEAGGGLEIRSAPGAGTVLRARIPA